MLQFEPAERAELERSGPWNVTIVNKEQKVPEIDIRGYGAVHNSTVYILGISPKNEYKIAKAKIIQE